MAYQLRQEYLICYDIEDNRIRTKSYQELEKYGLQPIQKSVFWGYLTNAEFHSVHRYLEQMLGKRDMALITHACVAGRGQSSLIGYEREQFRDWDESGVI